MKQHINFAGRAGRLSAAHWKTAAFGWLAFAIVAVVLGSAVGAQKLKDSQTASGEAARALQILENADFKVPASESVLVQSSALTYKDPAFSSAVAGVVQTLSGQKDVTNIISPIEHPKAGQVSRDGHSVLVQFDIKGDADKAKSKVAPILKAIEGVQASNPSFRVEEFGQASAAHEQERVFTHDLSRAEVTSLPLTLVILLVAFGALVAAGLPVLLAITAVLAATGVNTIFSYVVPSSDATSSVILMIGMAVGVDYSLFYLQREREERRSGKPPHESLLRTASTSGQAVLISGATVLIAMAGMLFAGNAIFTTIGVGTMIVVLAAMVGSLTVLPALLHRLGDKVEKGRIPLLGRRSDEHRFWSAIVNAVLKRPVVSVTAAAGLLVAATIPAFSMHTKLPSFTDLPKDLTIVRTYEDIQRAFPGSQTPAVLVVKGPVTSWQYRHAYGEFQQRALVTGLLFNPFHVTVNPRKDVARIDFSIAGTGDDETSMKALQALRHDVIPPVANALPGVEVPLDRDRDDDDRAEPAVSRRRVRHLGRRLPARLGRGGARLHEQPLDRVVAAAVSLRDPVRSLDGLSRLHPQPSQGTGRRR